MSRLSLSALTVVLACTGCSSQPEPQLVPAKGAAKYDRSFDAAVGACKDIGVEVSKADRAAGRIAGTKDGVEVAIWLQWQANSGDTKIEFSGPGSIGQPWSAAYNRRMGR